ncbi:hypothetical protein DVH05_017248 [Phytophthora capsici]|nr:hypothetical protein DVH05_017248 [Phytophthora capsici]
MTVLHRGSVLAGNGPELQQQQREPIARPIATIGSEFAFLSFVSRENWIRQWCIRVISHVYFDRYIVFCIALNIIILAFVDFSVVDDSLKPVPNGKKFHNGRVIDAYSQANHAIVIFNHIFAGVFTVEFVLKVVASGFTGEDSYWTNPWNVIDFLMLFASFVAEIPAMPNVSEF